jgi:hypothetical protein
MKVDSKRIRLLQGRFVLTDSMDELVSYRRRSIGWKADPPAYIHPRILFGPGGETVTPGFLRTYNITHIINCGFESDSPDWFKTNFSNNYACLNAVDSVNANILSWYPRFENLMREFLADTGSKNIYVHCQCGINRSGFLSLIFACVRLNYAFKDVVNSILTQRPCALTNPSYFRQVKEYCLGV